MRKIKKIYNLEGKDYEYYSYEDIDDKEFKRLFNEEKVICDRRLTKGTADKWVESKIRLFGFFKSAPKMFDCASANNCDKPLNFYDISLCEK